MYSLVASLMYCIVSDLQRDWLESSGLDQALSASTVSRKDEDLEKGLFLKSSETKLTVCEFKMHQHVKFMVMSPL